VPEFDRELGPGSLGFEDEVLFYHQLLEAGFRLVTALDTVVEHHFDPSRLSRAGFLEIASKTGRSQAYVEYHWKHRVVAHPRWGWIKCWLRLLRWRLIHRHEYRQLVIPRWEELDLASDVSFYRQYLMERKRPRLYEKHGLVKRSTGTPTLQPQVPIQ
jgi:hypothetical protein